MPENFFVAARFASLKQAGEAYYPIQEMLRVEQATDLSIYRFQLRGVSHVVVLGEKPPAQVREPSTRP